MNPVDGSMVDNLDISFLVLSTTARITRFFYRNVFVFHIRDVVNDWCWDSNRSRYRNVVHFVVVDLLGVSRSEFTRFGLIGFLDYSWFSVFDSDLSSVSGRHVDSLVVVSISVCSNVLGSGSVLKNGLSGDRGFSVILVSLISPLDVDVLFGEVFLDESLGNIYVSWNVYGSN